MGWNRGFGHIAFVARDFAYGITLELLGLSHGTSLQPLVFQMGSGSQSFIASCMFQRQCSLEGGHIFWDHMSAAGRMQIYNRFLCVRACCLFAYL
jgi:hypothetical protein